MNIPIGAVAVDRHGIGWVYSWGVWFMAPHFNKPTETKP
jgi:hypothetical protein